MNYRFLLIAGALLFTFHELFVSNAYAYLDPGTGVIILQAIVGVLVGVGITLRVYWTKIKYILSERSSKSKNDE